MWWKKKKTSGDGPEENTRGHSGTCGALLVHWIFEMWRAEVNLGLFLRDINNYGSFVDELE